MTPENKKLERRLQSFLPYELVRRGDIFYAENEVMTFAFAVAEKPSEVGQMVTRKNKQGKEIYVELISPEARRLWDKPGFKSSQ